MALRVKSYYPTNIVIDGEIIPIKIARMTPEQAAIFNAGFQKLGSGKGTATEEEELEGKRFVVKSISELVTVEDGHIYLDDSTTAITDGLNLCRVFGARDEVLSELLMLIFMENRLNSEQKHVWKTRLAPFVPTPPRVAQRMMALADVTAADTVLDLGCGDGAIVVAAAQAGATAIGIDLDHDRIKAATAAAQAAGVTVTIKQGDLLDTDMSTASVVSIYLLAGANAKIRPLLERQLPRGARVVTHAFPMGGGWVPRTSEFVAPEGDETTAHLGARWVYVYQIDDIRERLAA